MQKANLAFYLLTCLDLAYFRTTPGHYIRRSLAFYLLTCLDLLRMTPGQCTIQPHFRSSDLPWLISLRMTPGQSITQLRFRSSDLPWPGLYKNESRSIYNPTSLSISATLMISLVNVPRNGPRLKRHQQRKDTQRLHLHAKAKWSMKRYQDPRIWCDALVTERLYIYIPNTTTVIPRAQELYESRGGRPGLPSLINLRFLWT